MDVHDWEDFSPKLILFFHTLPSSTLTIVVHSFIHSCWRKRYSCCWRKSQKVIDDFSLWQFIFIFFFYFSLLHILSRFNQSLIYSVSLKIDIKVILKIQPCNKWVKVKVKVKGLEQKVLNRWWNHLTQLSQLLPASRSKVHQVTFHNKKQLTH